MRTGLIAGYGTLPLIAARNLIKDGHDLCIIAFYEEVTADLSGLNVPVEKISVTQVGKIIKTLKNYNVDRVLFAGKVNKSLLFSDLKFDLTAVKLLAKLKNRKDDTLMNAVCEELARNGISVMEQSDALYTLFLEKGVYSKKKPNAEQLADVEFGLEIAKELGRLDIGQTVVVKDKAVLALEAIEGTDKAVIRGCSLAKKDAVVVKCAKPSQDKRFDIPTVGVDTLRNLADNGGRLIAIEAGATFVVDVDSCIAFADANKIIFMAI
ncbi:MAG: LpxI family protein [Deferribacterales bacterium]